MTGEDTKRVTIYDIAKVACTSATSVSRVLSNNGYPVREDLRERIMNAAKELNYSPNLLAKSLKSNVSKEIGVIIPNITNPFYPSAILGIEEEADKNGYNILLCNTLRNPQKERSYMQSLYEKQIKGVIISSMFEENDYIAEYIERGVEVVLLDQKINNTSCSSINFDCHKGAYMAVDYLVKCGHREIAFISSPLTRWTRKEIFKGYKEGLKNNKILLVENYVLITQSEMEMEQEGFEFKNGKLLAEMFIEKNVDATAVVSVNDMTAVGFMQQMHSFGKNIPEDISIIGFDDIPIAKMVTPSLTTIRYPSYELGKLAGKLLFEKLSNGNGFDLSLRLEPSLVIRGTVKVL